MTEINITNAIFKSFIDAAWARTEENSPEYCSGYADGEYDMDVVLWNITSVAVDGWKLVKVDEFGGGEGQGDYASIVWAQVPENDPAVVRKDKTIDSATLYLRIEGYYSSYNGTTWDVDNIQYVDPTFVQRTTWTSR